MAKATRKVPVAERASRRVMREDREFESLFAEQGMRNKKYGGVVQFG
jgi:hypothetical protein